jgi:hypothetical protein
MTNQKILDFFEFIYDRHLIYFKKEILKESSPWTEDYVLKTYKSCCVYRELDRGSKYIINKICNSSYTDETKLFNIVAYRFFNLDQTFDGRVFDTILDPWFFDFKKYEEILNNKVKEKLGIWNNAYIIASSRINKNIEPIKHLQVLSVLESLSKNIEQFVADFKSKSTAEEQILKIQEIPMVGPFLAGQIMLDLGYAGVTKFGNNDWVVVGPGAWHGLVIIFGEENITDKNCKEKVKYLALLQEEMFSYLKDIKGKDWWKIKYPTPYFKSDYLSLMDYQNSLCEYRKYYKLTRGLGKKRYYRAKNKTL